MAAFSHDALAKVLLGLEAELNKDVINTCLKELGQAGAIMLQEQLFKLTTRWLAKSKLVSIILDGDSTQNGLWPSTRG